MITELSELYNDITTTDRYRLQSTRDFESVLSCWLIMYLSEPVSSYHSQNRNDKQRDRMPMQGRSLSLCLMAGASVSLVLMLTFNALAGAGAAPSIFVGSVSDSSNKYETSITPAGKYWQAIAYLYLKLYAKLNLRLTFIRE